MREYLIAVNSKDAYQVRSDFIHSFLLKEPLVCQVDEDLFAHIHHASIPNSFYNIQSGENTFSISETLSGTTTQRDLSITPGNYTASSLRSELTLKLNSGVLSIEYAVVFNNETGKFTITTTTLGVTQFALTFDSESPRRSMGFNVGTFTSAANTISSDRVADLTNGRHLIHVHTSLATTSIYSSRSSRIDATLLGIIPIDVPNFSVIQYQIDQRHMCHLSQRFISSFDIALKDSEGLSLDFNGVGWEITLKVVFKRRQSPTQPLQRLIQLEREMLSIQQQRVLAEREEAKSKDQRELEAAKQFALQIMFSQPPSSTDVPSTDPPPGSDATEAPPP